MGSVVVSPVVVSDVDKARSHWGRPMALGPMTNRRPSGGKVRIGSADFVGGPVRYRMVSVAPAFDPDAVSMSPVKGWTAAHDPAWGVFIPGSALVAARSDRDRAA